MKIKLEREADEHELPGDQNVKQEQEEAEQLECVPDFPYTGAYLMTVPQTFEPNYNFGSMRQEHLLLHRSLPDVHYHFINRAMAFHTLIGIPPMEAAYRAYRQHEIPGKFHYVLAYVIKIHGKQFSSRITYTIILLLCTTTVLVSNNYDIEMYRKLL